ncbi:hypothetical protein SOR_0999 [Streptococcus oralis Uo5]|uniref:DUF1433 domain-containing protein n=2 Tax=Streptococcus oralis TaxID=1303 RepID=F2QDE0_STROU|nr:hypothetical protein [Streptococcus oralis]ORO64369.1 hypothetical protein B7714_05720 [Streptococcus oralis subsp. oralis]CBZ00658.1 hypothetical protein SOR_0999 [Streptococcus oralis Uo5]
MNISSNKKSHKWLLIVLLLATITAGGVFMFSMFGKSQEERRNREYEVSLVNALKNSYQGIEEIKITKPDYTNPPGSWSCDVEIKFIDKKTLKYGINHHLSYKTNYGGRQETNEDWQYLETHKGQTLKSVKITYSDSEQGEL